MSSVPNLMDSISTYLQFFFQLCKALKVTARLSLCLTADLALVWVYNLSPKSTAFTLLHKMRELLVASQYLFVDQRKGWLTAKLILPQTASERSWYALYSQTIRGGMMVEKVKWRLLSNYNFLQIVNNAAAFERLSWYQTFIHIFTCVIQCCAYLKLY